MTKPAWIDEDTRFDSNAEPIRPDVNAWLNAPDKLPRNKRGNPNIGTYRTRRNTKVQR